MEAPALEIWTLVPDAAASHPDGMLTGKKTGQDLLP
jgi:hypothetical protein